MSNYKISEHSKKQALLLEANKEQKLKKKLNGNHHNIRQLIYHTVYVNNSWVRVRKNDLI